MKRENEKFLTPELQKKLDQARGFSVKAEFPYVPKAFREAGLPKDEWPVFVLKSKDGIELAEVEDNSGTVFYDTKKERSEMEFRTGTTRLDTIRAGLMRVRNWQQEDGSRIDWSKDSGKLVTTDRNGASKEQNVIRVDAIIQRMNVALQRELQNAINERDQMSAEEIDGLKF